MKQPLTLIAFACALTILATTFSCKKEPQDKGSHVSYFVIDNATTVIDSVSPGIPPSDFYNYRHIIKPGDTVSLFIQFSDNPVMPRSYKLVPYPDFVKYNLTDDDQFHMRVKYKNKVFRNYKTAIVCGQFQWMDTVISSYSYRIPTFSASVSLQNEENQQEEISVRCFVELTSGAIRERYLYVDSTKYALSEAAYGGHCGYSWIFKIGDSQSLQLALGRKPEAATTFYIGAGVCQLDSMNIALSNPASNGLFYLASDAPSQVGRPVTITQDGAFLRISLNDLYLKYYKGGYTLISKAELYFKPFGK